MISVEFCVFVMAVELPRESLSIENFVFLFAYSVWVYLTALLIAIGSAVNI